MNSQNIDLMTDEDVNYHNLSEDVLYKLALDDELFIATSALVELRLRKSVFATQAASEILFQSYGDKYLQATALSVFFDMNRERAIDLMVKKAQHYDLYILNTIMELMIENEADFKFESDSNKIVNIVKGRLSQLDSSTKFPEQEIRDRWENIYKYAQNIQETTV